MTEKRTMTLNLTEEEMAALENMSDAKKLTKTAVLRQALRLYQLLDERLRAGEKIFLEDVLSKEKKELVVL